FLASHVPAATRDLPSFPTRRSSDLGNGFMRQPPIDQRRKFLRHRKARRIEQQRLPLDAQSVGKQQFGVEARGIGRRRQPLGGIADRKSTRLNSSHVKISYAVFCLKK